jgi:hypothetical protein
MTEPEIYCPICHWRPQPEDRWVCTEACGTEWNTFWTAGVCPTCGKQWRNTECLACDEMTPHKLWYHEPSEDKVTQQQTESSESG